MCTSFLTQLEPASADLLAGELSRVSGFRDAAKSQEKGKDVRHPGGRSSGAADFVLVQGFWLNKGPQTCVDTTVEDPATKRVGFVVVASVKRNLRNLARAAVPRKYPILLQVRPCWLSPVT